MKKTLDNKVNGNIFKTIVRGVVQEELVKTEKRLEKNLDRKFEGLTQNLTEGIKDLFDESFTRFKNATVNKLDAVIGELKKGYEELYSTYRTA